MDIDDDWETAAAFDGAGSSSSSSVSAAAVPGRLSPANGERSSRAIPLMKFCPHDSSMLVPLADNATKTLTYVCRQCKNHSEPADTNLVYLHRLKREQKDLLSTVSSALKDDPTLSRSFDALCAKCGCKEAVFFQDQGNTGTKINMINICCGCGNKWVV
jgi:DNA-directed RNA polymerase II subunit RPB9